MGKSIINCIIHRDKTLNKCTEAEIVKLQNCTPFFIKQATGIYKYNVIQWQEGNPVFEFWLYKYNFKKDIWI